MSDSSSKPPAAKGPSRRSFLRAAGLSALSALPGIRALGDLAAAQQSPVLDEAAYAAFYDSASYTPILGWVQEFIDFTKMQSNRHFVLEVMNAMKDANGSLAGEMRGEFGAEANREIASYVSTLKTDTAEWREALLHQGKALLEQKPDRRLIEECLNHPVFRESTDYQYIKDALPDVIREIHTLSRDPGKLEAFVNDEVNSYESIVHETVAQAEHFPSLKEEIRKTELSQRADKPNFADMAAARKAGGYPIPAKYSEIDRSRAVIGTHHRSSCEWRDRIQDASAPGSIRD